MKKYFYYHTLWVWLLMVGTLEAQIAYQGFEATPPANAWTFVSSAPTPSGRFNTGTDVWTEINTFFGINPSVGNQLWGARDVLCPSNGNQPFATLTFADVSVVGFTGVTIQFDYRVIGFNGTDNIAYTLVVDGTPQPQTALFGTGSTPGAAYVTETINVPPGASTVGLILRVNLNGGDEAGFDNFILDGTVSTVCPHTVTGFTPTTAPIGAEVRIAGTGFTAGTTVEFNGVAATSVQLVSATELIATVPAGATTGDIDVIESACTVNGGAFTLIEGGAGCGVSFSDLIISEVYDNNGGTLSYIEIFNGTGSVIDLTDYRINRFATPTSVSPSHSYNLPTTGVGSSLAPGQVLVGRVSTTVGSGVHDFVFPTSTSGFNADDLLELEFIPTGTVVDDFEDAIVGANGFVYRRNTTITGPNPNFTASEWTTATSGDQSDLGIYNVTTGGPPPTISSQPTDANGCNLQFAVTATASNAGPLTYQWLFHPNDGVATTWSVVTGADFPTATVSGETSATLTISGDLTNYSGYQFYVLVTESGSCTNTSEAAQFTLVTDRFFRTAQSGNWTDPATWEVATSAAGPWVATCTYPTADNSDYIHILNTHMATVNTDILADQLVIEVGGTVVIDNTHALTLNDGAGTDLLIEGTLLDNGAGGGNGLRFSTGTATWLYGTNGEVIKTGTSSVVQYRDHYEGGIAAMTSTPTWRFRHSGSNGIVSVATVNMFYPNLYFESTSGNHAFSNPSEVFQGASGFTTVRGNLSIGATGTGSVDVFNTNTNANPMLIEGDLIIGGNGAAGTSKLENNRVGTTGTGVQVLGSLQINANGQLDFSDGANGTPDGRFVLFGNWTDTNPTDGFREGESTVEFVGTGAQVLSRPGLGNERFHNVVVNKPSGLLTNQINNMVVENNMDFVNGIVETAVMAYVVFEADATATNASNNSHVDGPVVRETTNGVANTFTYPTGDNGIYGAIGIQTRNQVGQDFVAEYFNVGYGSYNLNTAELDHVSILEYWNLDEFNGSLGEELRVTLHWGPHSRVITPSSIRVAHYFTQAPSLVNQWEREGNTPVITGTAMNGTVESDWVTSFSPFTLADVIDQTSLPLHLLRFEVNKQDRQAHIEWEVAHEQAGDQYCLQRSQDGITFEDLICLEATQDKSLAAYQHIDENPMYGYNYYRIHQIDAAGVSDYSPTKVVDFGKAGQEVQLYPNPTNGVLWAALPIMDGDYQFQIIDALGRVVKELQINAGQGVQQLNVAGLAAGTYVVRMTTPEGDHQVQRITITE